MSHNLLKNTIFHAILFNIDNELTMITRAKGCIYCDGPLYTADYPRSPLGLDRSCREYFERRRSLCCGSCRKRTKVPSVRFMGRLRYPALTFVLMSLFKDNISARSLSKVQDYFGLSISRRTWRRWRTWWEKFFLTTKFWQYKKSLIPIKYIDGPFPKKFICFYTGTSTERLVSILRFLSPMTAGIYQAV